MKKYDSVIIGPVSLDINIDCEGVERRELGGAVVQSGYAAAKCGFRTLILTKADRSDADTEARFADSGADLITLPSAHTCSIKNQYLTPDKERRICTSLGVCDPFVPSDLDILKESEVSIVHLAGLVWGDFSDEVIFEAGKYGKVGVDAQCLLRHVENDRSMGFHDWPTKEKCLPHIDFFKVDAAEAEILTGLSDRKQAAARLFEMGAKEIVLTHNTEVLAYDGKTYYTCPIKARNLSGRTGRGDTTFAGYLNSRIYHDIPEALLFATALVSLKMETPGPFMKDSSAVNEYIKEFYSESPVAEEH